VHSALTVVLAASNAVIWLLVGAGGAFWPVWPALGLGILLCLHAWIRHSLPTARERVLTDRVEVLTRDSDPALLAELLTESRASTLTALDDRRTVMRGIQPPVLADRGLEGAVRALAPDLAVPVTVSGDIPGRVPVPVESAACFAVRSSTCHSTRRTTGGSWLCCGSSRRTDPARSALVAAATRGQGRRAAPR
jgi:hypothetical protein